MVNKVQTNNSVCFKPLRLVKIVWNQWKSTLKPETRNSNVNAVFLVNRGNIRISSQWDRSMQVQFLLPAYNTAVIKKYEKRSF